MIRSRSDTHESGVFCIYAGVHGVPHLPQGEANIFIENLCDLIFPSHGCWLGTPVGPRMDTKDPEFMRIRSMSDRSEIVIKKCLNIKKLGHFPCT